MCNETRPMNCLTSHADVGKTKRGEARRGEARRGSGHWVTHTSHPPRNVSTLCLALGVPHLPCRAAPLALRPLLVNLSKHEECEPFRRLTLGAHNSVVPVLPSVRRAYAQYSTVQ